MAIIILGRQRTGTTLLSSFLNSHPDLNIEGEILHPTRVKAGGLTVLRNMNNEKWGFNLKYNHTGEWIFSNMKYFKVIHVIRKDLLMMAISSIINTNKKQYKRPSETLVPLRKEKWIFDVDKVRMAMNKNRKYMKRWLEKVPTLCPNFYTIYYEDFTSEGDSVKKFESSELCSFLKIPEFVFTTKQVKVNATSIKDIAINYKELLNLPNRSLL